MNQQDNDFFETYKQLDSLCGDIFHCKNGVSEYIRQMEETDSVQDKIADWSNDYKMLKHTRWIRNQIAHTSSTASFSTEEDLEFVTSFYERILNQDNPFARLRTAVQTPAPQKNTALNVPHSKQLPNVSDDRSQTIQLFVIGIILVFLIWVFLRAASL